MKWWYETTPEDTGRMIAKCFGVVKDKWDKERDMEFDKSRCYSALNADELRAGDKVIVGDTINALRQRVQKAERVWTIKQINPEDCEFRFETNDRISALAYLVERKENCTNCEYSNLHNNLLYCDDDKIPIIIGGEKLSVCSKYKPKTEKKECCLNCKHYNKANDFRDCRLVNNPTGACPHYEAEKKVRPFHDVDELIKVWDSKHSTVHPRPAGTMPLIWVRSKEDNTQTLITAFEQKYQHVRIGGVWNEMNDLFKEYEFLDGSPCGVEE